MTAKSPQSDINDTTLVWDANYGTWRLFQGIFANDYTVYLGQVVYASSADQNVYAVDDSVYQDIDEDGVIFSRYSSPNLTFDDALHWKRMRYCIFKGLISENAKIEVSFIFDGNPRNTITRTIDGSNEAILQDGVSISFGNVVFSTKPFAAFEQQSDGVPMREFLCKISLSTVNFYEVRIVTEENGVNTDYVMTHIQPFVQMQERPHFEPQKVK